MKADMYKPDPSALVSVKPSSIQDDDKKIANLESKVNRLIEQVSSLQADLDRVSRSVKRQSSTINDITRRVNNNH
jgi:peptidoglycan hydrolase CwlO-like protein